MGSGHVSRIANADPDPDGLVPTRAIEVSAQGEATEVSLARAVTPSVEAPSRTRPLMIASAAAFVFGIGAVALFAVYTLSHRVTPAASTSSDIAATASTTSSASASTAVTTAIVPTIEETTTASSPVKPPPPAAHRDPCMPPYTVDARGIRHLKHECLK